jgi:peroxiredoxin
MLIKSIFLGFYPILALGLFSIPFLENQPIWLTLLLLLVALPFPVFIGNLYLYKTARTTANLIPLILVPAIALTFTLLGLMITGSLLEFPLTLLGGFASLIGNLLYVFWYSRFGRKENQLLKVGQALPKFSLKDSNGSCVTSEQISQQASLILFYRGNWCPLCMAQIKEVAAQYRELESRGIKIFMVSPQSEAHTRGLAKRFDVDMHFLIDEGSKVADKLQIVAKNGLPMGLQALGYDSDTVMPTVVMTNKEGKIIFADLTDNYRVRPEPEDFLRVFDSALV